MAKDHSESTRDYIFLGLLRDEGRQTYWFRKRRLTGPDKGKVSKVTCTGCVKLKDAKAYRSDCVKEQEQIERQQESDDNGSGHAASITPLRDLFAEWCNTLKAELRPSTHHDLEVLCKPVQVKKAAFKREEHPEYRDGLYPRAFADLERTYPREVTYGDIEKLLKITWEGLGGRTLMKHYYNLRRFFGWCIKHKIIRENPAAAFEIPDKWHKEIQKAAKNTGQVMTREDAQRFLLKCREKYKIECKQTSASGAQRVAGQTWEQEFEPPPHLYTAVLTGFQSGLRLGNILGMRWRHLDLAKGVMRFKAAEMKNDEDIDVPMHRELWEHLRDVLAARTEKKGGRAPHPDDLVLGEKAAEIKTAFNSALRRADLWNKEKPFRCHDMRHTFRTWLYQVGAGDAAERLLGHKIPGNDVMRRYVHLTIDDLRREVNKLPRLMSQEVGAAQNQA